MIIAKEGMVTLQGRPAEILTDLAVVTDCVNKELKKVLGEEEAKNQIMQSIGFAFMSDEELEATLNASDKEERPLTFEEFLKILFNGGM